MKPEFHHRWDLSPKEAIRLQDRLAKFLLNTRRDKCPLQLKDLEFVAGADVSYSKKTDTCYAAVVVFKFPSLEVVEERTAVRKSSYPYVPGLLTFREGPPLISAFSRLKNEPDLLVFDGQGIAHPRRLGLATHIGLIYGKPSIGCAKSVLTGEFTPPGPNVGDWSPLTDGEDVIGCVLRTKVNCKPLFISPGVLMDVEWARRFIIHCLGRYRLPEIVRQPHLLSNRVRLLHEKTPLSS